MTCLCPTCNQPFPETALPLLDVNGFTVYFRGRKAKLWMQKISILHAVIKAYPGIAKWRDIERAVWGNSVPDSGARQIQVLATSLRRETAHMDFRLVTHRSLGYSMKILPDSRETGPEEAAAA